MFVMHIAYTYDTHICTGLNILALNLLYGYLFITSHIPFSFLFFKILIYFFGDPVLYRSPSKDKPFISDALNRHIYLKLEYY